MDMPFADIDDNAFLRVFPKNGYIVHDEDDGCDYRYINGNWWLIARPRPLAEPVTAPNDDFYDIARHDYDYLDYDYGDA